MVSRSEIKTPVSGHPEMTPVAKKVPDASPGPAWPITPVRDAPVPGIEGLDSQTRFTDPAAVPAPRVMDLSSSLPPDVQPPLPTGVQHSAGRFVEAQDPETPVRPEAFFQGKAAAQPAVQPATQPAPQPAVRPLVERFDIEPFSDFSAK